MKDVRAVVAVAGKLLFEANALMLSWIQGWGTYTVVVHTNGQQMKLGDCYGMQRHLQLTITLRSK